MSEERLRRTGMFDVASVLTAYDTISLWVGEYAHDSVSKLPEFAVADGIVKLRRLQAGFSQSELAAGAGVTRQAMKGPRATSSPAATTSSGQPPASAGIVRSVSSWPIAGTPHSMRMLS